jgi:hypothetical protein
MATRILVRRTGFTVFESDRVRPKEVRLDPRDQLPLVVALLHSHPRALRGVPAEDLWQSHLFRHLESLGTFNKTMRRHVGRLDDLSLGRRKKVVRIEYGAGVSKGTYRLVRANDTEISLAPEVQDILEEGAAAKLAHWQVTQVHDLAQLADFARTIQYAAALFDQGDVLKAEEELQESLANIVEPRYRAVVLFRMVRARLRHGDEGGAKDLIAEATELIEGMPQSDPVLNARVQYNRAWLAYTQGDFSYQPILRAERALASAAPDDIRHGFVATQHGLIVVKDIERNYADLSDEAIIKKGREALAYLTHAVYLLVRSEDFWGAQEACWNLAFGLFHIGNIKSVVVPHIVGHVNKNYDDIMRWLDVSDRIGDKHHTGDDSRRNNVLKASVLMTRKNDLEGAADHLPSIAGEGAEELARTTSPRDLGRIYERWVEYYIRRAELHPEQREDWDRLACAAYDMAYKIWNVNDDRLHSLIKNELEAEYRRSRSPDRVLRR